MTTDDKLAHGTVTDLDGRPALWLQAYEAAEAQEKHWADIKKQAREHLEQALGDSEIGTVGGVERVRWTFVKSSRLDQKKLKEQAPDLVAQCTVESTSRRFTLVGGDK